MDNDQKDTHTMTPQERFLIEARVREEERERIAEARRKANEAQKKAEEDEKRRLFMYGAGAVLLGSATAYLFKRYKTSKSNEWLVKTGIFVNDMQIGKKFFQLPFQNIQRIVVTPTNYNLNINSMSKEKMEFKFPVVFTMGPKVDEESLTKYSRFMLNLEDKDAVIKGIIEGEARALAANISIEEIFAGRNEFKNNIINHVQPQLDQYGIAIYNANIEELRDSDSSNYFKSLALRIKAEAENKAKVQVAEQNKLGQIGSKEREAETRQRVASVESETIIVENQRKQEMLKSSADLEKTTAEQEMIINLAKIKAQNEAEKIKMDMECEVEAKRQKMEVERARATELSKTLVDAEKTQKEAEGFANAQKIKADAVLYAKMKDAEGVLYAKTKEAEGLAAMYEAQSSGIHKLVESFGGDRKSLISYMMLERDQFTKLADSSAKAIQGLQPKITIWNTGPGDNNPYKGIANLGQSVVPMLDTIKEQTGYALPDWLIKDGAMNTKAPEMK